MNQNQFEKSPLGPVTSGKPLSSPAAHDSRQAPVGSRGVHGSLKKRVCFGSMAVVPEEPVPELPRKRLRPNNSFMMQVRFSPYLLLMVFASERDLVCLEQLCICIFASWHTCTGTSPSGPTRR